LGLGPDEMDKEALYNSAYDVAHKKTQTIKLYLHCRREDLQILLRVEQLSNAKI